MRAKGTKDTLDVTLSGMRLSSTDLGIVLDFLGLDKHKMSTVETLRVSIEYLVNSIKAQDEAVENILLAEPTYYSNIFKEVTGSRQAKPEKKLLLRKETMKQSTKLTARATMATPLDENVDPFANAPEQDFAEWEKEQQLKKQTKSAKETNDKTETPSS